MNRIEKIREGGWIGVDFDGTLAMYDGWQDGFSNLGEPIPLMVDRVKEWLSQGQDVRIVTARFVHGEKGIAPIRAWCKKHIGQELPVQNHKDPQMIVLWDDRCIRVEPNTGRIV